LKEKRVNELLKIDIIGNIGAGLHRLRTRKEIASSKIFFALPPASLATGQFEICSAPLRYAYPAVFVWDESFFVPACLVFVP